MALLKNVQHNGQTLSYWHVRVMLLNFAFKTATIHLHGFFNQSQASNGEPAVASYEFTVEADKFDSYFTMEGNQAASAYLAAKGETTTFEGATDVLEP